MTDKDPTFLSYVQLLAIGGQVAEFKKDSESWRNLVVEKLKICKDVYGQTSTLYAQ
jgi:hypothetical protein